MCGGLIEDIWRRMGDGGMRDGGWVERGWTENEGGVEGE